jgi:hypothetical protein
LSKNWEINIEEDEIIAVGVDDFALKKKHNYGTVIVNLKNNRVKDIIESRETVDVQTH